MLFYTLRPYLIRPTNKESRRSVNCQVAYSYKVRMDIRYIIQLIRQEPVLLEANDVTLKTQRQNFSGGIFNRTAVI